MVPFRELNNDQRRELVNSQQRFQTFREARNASNAHRGSVTWTTSKGREYLVRSFYDKSGLRKQKSLGPRSAETERIKLTIETRRTEAEERFKNIRDVLTRQSAINRALGLGRVPLIGARIMRSLESFGLLGAGIVIVGTNAMFAYEAVAGVQIDSSLATTEDIDLLLDARSRLALSAAADVTEMSVLNILKKADATFQRSRERFRAANRDGYLVDLIQPMPDPHWKKIPGSVGTDPEDLNAVQIDGLAWLQNAPPFEAISIDERGEPVRMITADPRVWAAHKLWLSKRTDRDPLKKRRDADQAHAVARLVTEFLPHLPFEQSQLRMIPKDVFDAAAPMFEKN